MPSAFVSPTQSLLRAMAAPTAAPLAARFDWRRGAAGALLWAGVAQLSQTFLFDKLDMGMVWPADGIAIGLGLAYGPRMVPFIGAGVAIWHATQGIAVTRSIAGVLTLMFTMLVIWWLAQRSGRTPGNPAIATLRYHLRTALVGAGVLTSVGVWQFLMDTVRSPGTGLADIVRVLFVSELFGLLLFCRLTELAAQALDAPGPRRWLAAVEPWQAAWLLAWAIMIGAATAQDASSARYAVFVLVTWAACLAGPLLFHAAMALSAMTLLELSPSGGDASQMLLDQATLVICLACLGFLAHATMEHHRATESMLREAANRDPLTGLLSERGLAEALSAPQAQHGALIGIVVRNLNQIRELIGLPASRGVEQAIASLLRNALPDAPWLGRPHDGFLVACVPPGADAAQWCAQLHALLDDRRWNHGERGVRLQVAVGAIDLDAEARDVHEDVLATLLLACQITGDAAEGEGAAVAISSQPDSQLGSQPGSLIRARRAQLARLEALKDALHAPAADRAVAGRCGLWLACQPIHRVGAEPGDAAGGGMEVLLRWSTAEGAPVPPADFLPLAERHGLMPQIDRWVVTQTVRALAAHGGIGQVRERLGGFGHVAINLSGASVSDPLLLEYITTAIRGSGLPASLFCFEITETAGIARPAEAARLLASLRALGAKTALDDFGTGLATFDYLKTLPLDIVKIDGRFVRDVVTSRVDQRIVAATCEVARAMGLHTVAEFVETPQQRTLLATYGVDYVQGYGIARPLPLGEYLGRG